MITSVFVRQEGTFCDFKGKESWVILTPIEQSIKRKIEAVGTPLKDWDIQINYGIKTGYNEAFIIDTAKRDEILANCKTEDERQRTAELIRPCCSFFTGVLLVPFNESVYLLGCKVVEADEFPANEFCLNEWTLS